MKKRDGWGVALALGSLCLLAGLAVVSLCFRPAARTSAPATAEECRAAAEALGLPYVEESALTPLLPEGLSLERRQLRMDAPRAGKTVGYALEFAASQEGSACAAARVSVYAPCARRKGRGRSVSGQPWKRHRGGAVLALWRGPRPGGLRRAGRIRRRGGGQPALLAADGRRALRGTFYHGRALHRPGARGRGGASAANPRRFGGAEPGKRGQNLSAAEKLCIMGRGLNRG